MNPPDAMLDAIYLGDDPDTAALVVADWYDEHDQPERGRLIRLCVRMTQMAVDDPMRYEVADERDRLLGLHGDAIYGSSFWRDVRGFTSKLADVVDEWGQPRFLDIAQTLDGFADVGGQLAQGMTEIPYRRLGFFGNRAVDPHRPLLFERDADETTALLNRLRPVLRGLHVVHSRSDGDLIFRWLVAHASHMSLEYLAMSIPNAAMLTHPVLLDSPVVASLRSLRIMARSPSPVSLATWRQAIWAKRIRSLTVAMGPVTAGATIAVWDLLDGRAFPELRSLSFESDCSLGDSKRSEPGLEPPPQLQVLRLNRLHGDEGQFADLGRYLRCSRVTDLQLRRGQCAVRCYVRLFTALGSDSSIRRLTFGDEHRSSSESQEVLTAIGAWTGFSRLQQLELHHFPWGTMSSGMLGQAVGASAIESLTLSSDPLELFRWNADRLRRLAFGLRPGQLRDLQLLNIISPGESTGSDLLQGLIDLLGSPGVRRLRSLTLEQFGLVSEHGTSLDQSVELPELQTVRFLGCVGTEPVLTVIMRSRELPRLWRIEFDPQVATLPFPGWRLLRPGILICPERMT